MAFLAALLRREGWSVMWDLVPPGTDPPVMVRRTRELNPDAVIISSAPRFYCTCPVPTVQATLSYARLVRETAPKARRIVIGPISSARPEPFLEGGVFDGVCRGEPEASLLPVLAASSTSAWASLPGMATAGANGRPVLSGATPYADLPKLPLPARDLLPMEEYVFASHHARRTTAIQGSRGCSYACNFCFINRNDPYANMNTGKMFRVRPAEQVVEEIRMLRERYCIDGLFFEDVEFLLNLRYADVLTEAIAKHHPGVTWSCQTRVTTIRRDFLRELKRRGCREVYYGVESGNGDILEKTDKHISLEAIEQAFRWTREAGIKTVASFVLGLPEETVDSVQDTIRLARRIRADYASFHIFSPFVGTRLYEEARRSGFLSKDEIDQTRVHANLRGYRTAALTSEDLDRARRRAYRSFYLDPGYLARKLMGSSPRQVFFYLRTLVGARRDMRSAEASVIEALVGARRDKLAS
jgi:radical SAM superfamily enzyme YgiQ (UPF0313 family)